MTRCLAIGLLALAAVALVGGPVAVAAESPAPAPAGAAKAASQTPAATPATPAGQPAMAPKRSQDALGVRIIRGTLTPPDRVKKAYLWERAMDLRIPVTVDPKTGAFEVTGLRLGTYDLVIETPWGRLEGLDMAPKVSEYDALIPPEYRTEDLGGGGGGPFTEEDRKAIRRIIYEVKRYENKIRDLYLTGSSDKSVALMELLMDGDFVGRKGDEITWRIEQWFYEKNYDAWTTFRTRVLYRFRVSKAEWQTWGWQFEPALGGFNISVDRKEPVVVEYAIPEKPVPEKGLVGTQLPPADKGRPKEPPPSDTAEQ